MLPRSGGQKSPIKGGNARENGAIIIVTWENDLVTRFSGDPSYVLEQGACGRADGRTVAFGLRAQAR
jgi:hypothetical protein